MKTYLWTSLTAGALALVLAAPLTAEPPAEPGGEVLPPPRADDAPQGTDDADAADPPEAEAGDDTDTDDADADDADASPKPMTPEEVDRLVEEEFAALTVLWTSLNKNAQVDLRSGQTTYNLSFSGQMTFPNDTRIVGVASQVVLTEGTDEDGNNLLPTRPDIVDAMNGDAQVAPNLNYNPLSRYSGGNGAPSFSFSAYMNNMPRDPGELSKLSGYVALRVATDIREVELPLEQTAGFERLVPGLSARVQQVSRRASGDTTHLDLTLWFVRPDDPPQQYVQMDKAPLVVRVDVLDAAGDPIQAAGNSYHSRSISENGESRYVFHMQNNYRFPATMDPKRIRLVIAERVVDRPKRFSHANVPMP